MKLYLSRRAPNPRRVAWFLAEKGAEGVEIVDLDVLKGEHRDPAFKEQFGVALLPALVLDDGTRLTESVAICRYLESLYPEPNLFGQGARETAVIEMWTRRAELMAANPLMQTVRHSHPALAVLETQIPEVAQFFKGEAERALGLFDAQLKDHAFIAGERITMADIVLASGLDFARLARFKPSEDLANLNRWREAMMARPAASAGV
jgi:glutathione S-transferase